MSKLESIQDNLRDFRENVMARKYKEGIQTLGLGEASRKMLKTLNIQPKYSKKDDPLFSEWREKLNHESGILISNHPGGFDIISVLSTLDRKDIKFFVSEEVYERWSGIFGKEHVLPAPKIKPWMDEEIISDYPNSDDQREASQASHRGSVQREYVKIMRSITDHIKSGGLFIFFPTGGDDSRKLERFQFKDLFRVLLRKIEPETMVYSLNIRSDEMKSQMEQAFRIAGSFSDMTTGGKLNWNRLREPLLIDIDENYADASEWQNLLTSRKLEDRDALTEHYLEKFPAFYSEVLRARKNNYNNLEDGNNYQSYK